MSRSRQDPDASWRALWRLAEHAIGQLGAVKLKDLTVRQVQKALAELSASRSTRPPGRLCSASG